MKKYGSVGVLFFGVLLVLTAGGVQAQPAASIDLAALTKELVALEDQYAEAFVKNDPALVIPILADDFEMVGPDGTIWTKARLIELVKERKYEVYSITIMDARARKYGNTAILSGLGVNKGKVDGIEYHDVYRFQDVWINRDGGWQAIAGQNAPAEKEMPISTVSSKAMDLFIQGREKLENYESIAAAPLFEQAAALDTNFALAYCYRAQSGGGYQIAHANRAKAMAHAGQASLGEQLYIQWIQAAFDGNQGAQKQYLDQRLALYPGDKRSWVDLGSYYLGISDQKSAIANFEKACEIDKDFAPAYAYLPWPYIQLGQFAAAETALKEYIRLRPDRSDPYDTYGFLLCKTGRYDESIAQYQKALELSDQSPWSLAGIGANYLYKGDYGKAREYFQMYYDKSSRATNKIGALFLTATSYLYEGKLSQALKGLAERRALAQKEKQLTSAINSLVFEGLAQASMGKPSEGIKKLNEGMAAVEKAGLTDAEKDGFRTWGESCYVYTYAQAGQLDQARAHAALLDKAVKRRSNPGEKDMMPGAQANIDMAEKKYDAVIAGVSTMQPDPYNYFMMGEAALAKGDKEAARGYYKKAAEFNEFSFNQAVIWNRVHAELKKLED